MKTSVIKIIHKLLLFVKRLSMKKVEKKQAWEKIDSLITDLVAQQIGVIEQNMLFKSVLNIGNV